MKKFSYLAALSLALPFTTSAAINSVWDIFDFVKNILNTLLPLIIALAVVYFVWGIFQYTVAADEEKKKEAQSKIIYGVVGLFVMISIWGLVNILVNTFGLNNSNAANSVQSQLPSIPVSH